MNTLTSSLTVLKGLEKDGIFQSLSLYSSCGAEEKKALFDAMLYEIFLRGAECGLADYLSDIIICDDNPFSRKKAAGAVTSSYLEDAFVRDLITIQNAVEKLRGNGKFEVGFWDDLLCGTKDAVLGKLSRYYSRCGYGDFIKNTAFTYENGALCPIKNADKTALSDLKNYDGEKKIILDNVGDFLNGLPYSHMLLYGDKGTGKSSTVHAVVNKFSDKKLRLVEIANKDIDKISEIERKLSCAPLKFILFMDDLSLEGDSALITELKTILEGSFSDGRGNVMFVATSNRRHIVKENMSDRQNSVHPADLMEEQLSLSDRFGLTVMFSATDKEGYLSIVRQLAEDRGLNCDGDSLAALAERWAIVKGGRSPRRAKQFIDFMYSCEKTGRKPEI